MHGKVNAKVLDMEYKQQEYIMPNKEEKNIEELFKDLEQVLADLENNNTSLEDSFRIYENGMKLVSEVSSKIDKVEKELVILEDK